MPLAVRIEVMTEKCKQLDQKVAVVGRQIKEREIQYVGAPQSNSWDSLVPVFSVYIAKIISGLIVTKLLEASVHFVSASLILKTSKKVDG